MSLLCSRSGTVHIAAKPTKWVTFDTFFDNVSFDTDTALRFIKFSDLGNFFSWKYHLDYDILIIEETVGGVENGWEKQHKTGYHTKDILARQWSFRRFI